MCWRTPIPKSAGRSTTLNSFLGNAMNLRGIVSARNDEIVELDLLPLFFEGSTGFILDEASLLGVFLSFTVLSPLSFSWVDIVIGGFLGSEFIIVLSGVTGSMVILLFLLPEVSSLPYSLGRQHFPIFLVRWGCYLMYCQVLVRCLNHHSLQRILQ